MKYHQRDVVEINFPIPGEGYKVTLLLSCLMMTFKLMKDSFTS